MNGISGIDIAGKIRNHLKDNKTILIYISAHNNRAKELFRFNTHRFLPKPIKKIYLKRLCLAQYNDGKNSNFKTLF